MTSSPRSSQTSHSNGPLMYSLDSSTTEPTAPDPGDAERRAPNVTDQHVQAGEEVAAAISDENLRKLVAKAAAASLAKPPDDRSV